MSSPFILPRGVTPLAAPPGFPPDVVPNQVIQAAHINAIRDSAAVWPGNVNGNGKTLTGVAAIGSAIVETPLLRSAADMVFGVGAGYPERMRIVAASGNIGLFTTNPVRLFQVRVGANQNLAISTSGSVVQLETLNDAATVNVPLWYTASAHIFQVGSVGIGTSNPQSPLDVAGSISGGRVNVTFTNQGAAATGNRIRLRLGPSAGFINTDIYPYIESYTQDAPSQASGLAFGTYSGGSYEVMRITASGGIALPFLPASNPGAGTKLLWYDPADGNTVKFAA
jgi:hypothetical protein